MRFLCVLSIENTWSILKSEEIMHPYSFLNFIGTHKHTNVCIIEILYVSSINNRQTSLNFKTETKSKSFFTKWVDGAMNGNTSLYTI